MFLYPEYKYRSCSTQPNFSETCPTQLNHVCVVTDSLAVAAADNGVAA